MKKVSARSAGKKLAGNKSRTRSTRKTPLAADRQLWVQVPFDLESVGFEADDFHPDKAAARRERLVSTTQGETAKAIGSQVLVDW